MSKLRIFLCLLATAAILTILSIFSRHEIPLYYSVGSCEWGTCVDQLGGDIISRAGGFPFGYYVYGFYDSQGRSVVSYDENCPSGQCMHAEEMQGTNSDYQPLTEKLMPIAGSERFAGDEAAKPGFHFAAFLIDTTFWLIAVSLVYGVVRLIIKILRLIRNRLGRKRMQ
ncbi:hypothetical protein EYC59_05150 [Candidatus Saccharibacteria bacterium]|nr:MAG: hypothetical protein EYC59_05150 [Candidatus Saccharibacteria bacterium]